MTNLEILKKIYSDSEYIGQCIHPDFKLHAPGNNLISGEFTGLDGMFAHLGKAHELSDGTMKLEPFSYSCDGDWGMVVSRITAARNGKDLDIIGIGIWRFADGKLAHHWEFADNQAKWDQFWS